MASKAQREWGSKLPSLRQLRRHPDKVSNRLQQSAQSTVRGLQVPARRQATNPAGEPK